MVFEDGLARKSEYRRFSIKGTGGEGDVASMHEVITRRFRRYLEERETTGELDVLGDPASRGEPELQQRKFAYPPNLVVIDGGPAQVAAAVSALDELGIDDIAVCGLAKRLEEVWLPGEDAPVILPRSSEGLYLLQRVRDEAHRFAITYHRAKRSKALAVSELDSVPGLGPARRATLLRHFGSVRRIAAATPAGAGQPARHRATAGQRGPDRSVGRNGETPRPPARGCHERRGDARMDQKVTGGKPPGPGTASPVTDIVIITGMSGAGRSTTAKTLEDLDWFVIDNLPPGLLPTMIDLARRAKGTLPKIAAVMDVRSRAFSSDLQSAISELATRGVRPRVVFLEAADDTLVRRFESVRRPHPLQEDGRVLDGIAAERELLRTVRGEADLVLDTSALNVHELRARLQDFFGASAAAALRVSVVSFGYKYGLPVDADLVADCRFLPNPRWIEALAPLTGQDERVRDYVLSQRGAADFLDAYLDRRCG